MSSLVSYEQIRVLAWQWALSGYCYELSSKVSSKLLVIYAPRIMFFYVQLCDPILTLSPLLTIQRECLFRLSLGYHIALSSVVCPFIHHHNNQYNALF